jgi:hypothetical protein
MLSAVGVGVWLLLGAAPARAAVLPPLPLPTLPPIVVAPPPVDVGPVHINPPTVAVTPSTPSVAITTHEAPPAPRALPPPPGTPVLHHAAAPAVAPKVAPRLRVATTPPPAPVLHHAVIRPAPRAPDVRNARATGAIVTPSHHAWTEWLGSAARNYGALVLLLLGALALRFFMGAALRAAPAPKRL